MKQNTKFVLAGFGNVGQQVAQAVLAEENSALEIAAISARDLSAAEVRAGNMGLNVPLIRASEAPRHARVIVECATYDAFRKVVEPAAKAGCHIIAVSFGALAIHMDLIDIAREHGATIQLASGTMPGLDLLRSARERGVRSVRLQTHILPGSLENEPYVTDNNIDLRHADREPVLIFSGTAREAAACFPRHINVAISLSLAGVGLDRTRIDIYANGDLPGARHQLSIEAEAIRLQMTSQNFPSPGTKKTSQIVALSILAALREIDATLRVGS